MAKSSGFNLLRVITPSQLGICLILFFLPWIEIQCVPPKSAQDEKEKVAEFKKETAST
ncbi:MAG: hypothetical protein L0241_25905 [Planctomycetia bacterium]|nr:hypothetical protein [Planctomycetia bacterium]